MNNTSVKLTPFLASSYAWDQGTINKKFCVAKVLKSVAAFICAVLGKYSVSEVDAELIYKKLANKKLYKDAKKCGLDKRVIIENRSNSSEEITSPIKEKDLLLEALEKMVENDRSEDSLKPICVDVPENLITDDTPEVSLEPSCVEVQEIIIEHYTPQDFVKLIGEGEFSEGIHYVVDGSLDLSHWRNNSLAIIILPERLTVEGEANFSHQRQLTKLPKDFIVTGNLNLTGCEGLTDLSNSRLLVHGHLNCKGCINMKSAPNELTVRAGAYFIDCFSLVKLPDNFSLRGKLLLKNCYSVESLSKDLKIDGDFVVVNCTDLKGPHNGLSVNGYNSLSKKSKKRIKNYNKCIDDVPFKVNNSLVDTLGNTYKAYSPEGFIKLMNEGTFLPNIHYVITGSLRSRSYTSESSMILPDNLTVMGNVYFAERHRRIMLPKEFIVKGHLTLNGCRCVIGMSQSSFTVGGDLNILNCNSIIEAPKELHVVHSICFMGCRYLATFPKDLIVECDLTIMDSSKFKIPETLTVHGDLVLARCSTIKTVPESLVLGGMLVVTQCDELNILDIPRKIKAHPDTTRLWRPKGHEYL